MYTSVEEWAHEHAEMSGWTEDLPQQYFDAEAFAHDAELNGDIDVMEISFGVVVIFNAH